jgi:hypothetical protein
MNVNVWDVAESIGRLIHDRIPVEDGFLADPGLPLDELVPAP